MIKIRFGDLDESCKKIKDKKIIIDNLGRELLFEFKAKNESDSYIIRISSLKNISRDKRKSFIEIKHINGPEHIINMVVDISHLYQSEFHLNLTNDSKMQLDNCSKCKMYFSHFNHLGIYGNDENGLSIIDVDMIRNQVLNNLEVFLEYYVQVYYADLTFDN